MTVSRERTVEVVNTNLRELSEFVLEQVVNNNYKIHELSDPELPIDPKRQRVIAEISAANYHLAVAAQMVSVEPVTTESAIERLSPIVDIPSDSESIVETDNFIEDFCAKNKFNKRHSAMIKKIYEQQSSGDWFKRGQLDMDKTAFNGSSAFNQAYNILVGRLVELGFLESNGEQKSARKYKISDQLVHK